MSEISKANLNAAQMNSIKSGSMADKKNPVTEEKFREVAEMYEKHFIRSMMKEMRATVHESGFTKQNNAEKIFREQLDDNYAEKWSQTGGFGLADMIHSQLMQKYGPQFGLLEKVEKPQGPIEFNAKSNIATVPGAQAKENNEKATHLKILGDPNTTVKTAEIKNPWAGTLLDKKYLEMDQMQYRIKHDNGLESLISTRGSGLVQATENGTQLHVGDKLGAGQQLGWRDSTSPLFWTIKPTVSE